MRAWAPAVLALAIVAPRAAAQVNYDDPLGRFAMTLPSGWKLASEQFDQLYQFERGDTKIILFVMDGTSDRAAAFRSAVAMFCGETPPPPPEGSVYDLVTNGNAARRALWTFTVAAGGKQVPLTAFLGTVTLEGANMSLAYMVMLNEKSRKQWETPIAQTFQSIRVRGASVTGASEPVAVADALRAEPEAPPSTFEHAIVTLDLPAGWTATPGDGPNVAVIEHGEFSGLRVMGLPGNEFGKSRDEVLTGVVGGVEVALPSFHQTSPPREETTAGGDVVLVAEYEGALVAQGKEIPQWVLVGALKHARGGVGFLWMTPPEKKDAGLPHVLGIIRSAR